MNNPQENNKCPRSYQDCRHRQSVYDWLRGLQQQPNPILEDIVEVSFKCRKDFYVNVNKLELCVGDVVAVESQPGHDIGRVTAKDDMALLSLKRKYAHPEKNEFKKLYRLAKPADIEKWESCITAEQDMLFRTRKIILGLKLQMKLTDIEYQGDGTKTIFYYSADDRVDFRQLIRVLAEQFRVRVEMKQIGVRQEAGRLGGLGSCGRELCCATWMNEYCSVNTNTARTQQLSPNPQKLTGQCAKLKCCLNYEQEVYLDKLKEFPDTNTRLKTKKGDAVQRKTEVFKEIIWFSYLNEPDSVYPIKLSRVKEILDMNRKGIFPPQMEEESDENSTDGNRRKRKYGNVVFDDNIHRFDKEMRDAEKD